MAQNGEEGLPEHLEQSQDRHPERRTWSRLIGPALLLAFVVAALLNQFGQSPTAEPRRAEAAAYSFRSAPSETSAPSRVS